VLWRSGVALAHHVAEADVGGRRVVELGCGLGAPSLAAARSAADVLATDADDEALELLECNARENAVEVAMACVDWTEPEALVARGPFDLVLAADVLYERQHVAPLLGLLPRLGGEVWLADPGRPALDRFLELARSEWSIESNQRGVVTVVTMQAL
jgi:predicted nicotinamide N-methyase